MNVVAQYQHTIADLMEGYRLRRWKLTITGLTQGSDNTVPHGLPCGPSVLRDVTYRAQEDGGWYEVQEPDATNLYIHVDASGPTKFIIEASHPY